MDENELKEKQPTPHWAVPKRAGVWRLVAPHRPRRGLGTLGPRQRAIQDGSN
jgi:hypothetical protein